MLEPERPAQTSLSQTTTLVLLRAKGLIGALTADASTGSFTGPLGQSEVQEAAQAYAEGDTLGGTDFPARSKAVGALADGCAA